MLLFELIQPKGTYAGVRFTAESAERIHQFAVSNGIPEPIPVSELHITLLYSRKRLPEYEPAGEYKNPLTATPIGVKLWGDDNDTVVVLVDCPALVKRHKALMKEHGATWDYEDYLPHVSLSYAAPNFDIKKLDYKSLGKLSLDTEYAEELDFDEDE